MVPAAASVLSELESLSSLKEKQRTALKAFFGGKNVFALLLTHFGKGLVYQVAPLVTGFVYPIGRSQSMMDDGRQMVYPITLRVCAFSNMYLK